MIKVAVSEQVKNVDTAARPVSPGCFKTENADSSNTAELLEAGLFLCWCVVKVRKLPIVIIYIFKNCLPGSYAILTRLKQLKKYKSASTIMSNKLEKNISN